MNKEQITEPVTREDIERSIDHVLHRLTCGDRQVTKPNADYAVTRQRLESKDWITGDRRSVIVPIEEVAALLEEVDRLRLEVMAYQARTESERGHEHGTLAGLDFAVRKLTEERKRAAHIDMEQVDGQ